MRKFFLSPASTLFACALRFESTITDCMADFLFHGACYFMRPFNIVLGAVFHDRDPFKSVQAQFHCQDRRGHVVA